MLAFLGIKSLEEAHGMKFGDASHCHYAELDPRGCGFSEHCPACAVNKAICNANKDEVTVHELTLKTLTGQSVVFRSRIKSIEVNGDRVIAILMQDISDEKRRETMERVFYHDLLNAAAGVVGLLEIIEQDDPDNAEARRMIQTARLCSEYLVDEINFSRCLSAAEKDALELKLEPVHINEIIGKAVGVFTAHMENGNVRIEAYISEKNSSIVNDKSLIVRILINLIKNAIEASRLGGLVTVRVNESIRGNIIFEVHNETVMSQEIQDQVFARAFTTKGKGRGIGTYSVKLFTEQYLKGRVWFTSEEGQGTSFFVRIPTVVL